MTTLLQEGCLDWFAHEELSPTQMKNVYIYVEGEYGFIPLIVGKSMEESKPLIASIMSRYQNVESFNRMPKPNDPSWRVTAVKDDTIFIAITNWFPHSDGRGEPSPTLCPHGHSCSPLAWLAYTPMYFASPKTKDSSLTQPHSDLPSPTSLCLDMILTWESWTVPFKH